MNEEILRIQKMVAEGKISSEEGAKLVESIKIQESNSTSTRMILSAAAGGILLGLAVMLFLSSISERKLWGLFTVCLGAFLLIQVWFKQSKLSKKENL